MALTPRRVFLALSVAVLPLKLWLASAIPLLGDEAWYWLEGRHPAWAYSDLPGLTAWLARLGVAIGGDTPLGLRWPFLLLGVAMPWLIVRSAARWFGEDAGWRAGTLALLLPLGAALGLLALPDVPLVFATLLAFDACAALLERYRGGACVQLAIALAIGATSHYRFAIALFAGGLGLIASREGRALLRTPGVLVALTIGALAWSPIAWFNVEHHEAGLRFQLVDRHPWSFHWYGWKLQLAQPLIVGPLLYVALWWALWQAWRRRADSRWKFLLIAAGLPIALFVALAPFVDIQRVSFHWPLSADLSLLICVPWLLHEAGARRSYFWIVMSNAIVCAMLGGFAIQLARPDGDLRLARAGFHPEEFAGWNEVGAGTRERLAAMPSDTVVVVDDFILAAELEFALRGAKPVLALDHPLNAKHGRALQLSLWRRDESALPDAMRHPILFVADESALTLVLREPWNRHQCAVLPGLDALGVLDVDEGRRSFLFYRRDPGASAHCDAPALAFLDIPLADAEVSGAVDLRGWASQDGVGVARVDVLLDGRAVVPAQYGTDNPGVRSQWPDSDDPQHPYVGFLARVDLRGVVPGEHTLALRVTGHDGRARILERRTIRVLAAR
jgi:hypothetical protein